LLKAERRGEGSLKKSPKQSLSENLKLEIVPTKHKIYLLITLGVLTIAAVVFSNLSDLTKAKYSLQLLGIHQKNKPCFSKVTALILEHKYDKCTTLDAIQSTHKTLLTDFYKNNRTQDSIKQLQLSDIYAIDGERWSNGCQPEKEIPQQKFEYLLYSDKNLIVCTLVGGIGISSFFEFYEIKTGSLVLTGTANVPISSLFTFALLLRFKENLIDCGENNTTLLLD